MQPDQTTRTHLELRDFVDEVALRFGVHFGILLAVGQQLHHVQHEVAVPGQGERGEAVEGVQVFQASASGMGAPTAAAWNPT